MKKKLLTICLAAIVAVTAIAGASLAYFTDTDTEKNTFTVGNVKIDLIESQYHRVNAGKGETTEAEPISGGYLWASGVELKGTPENTPNYTTSGETWSGKYFSDEQILEDAKTYKDDYFQAHSTNMVPGSNVRKNPYVKNTGSNDAYVRVRVLIPVSLFKVLDEGYSYWTSTALNEGEVTSKSVDTYKTKGYEAVTKVTRDSVEYYEFDFTYVDALKPGELTFWNVWGNIAIDPDATSNDLKEVKSFDVIFEADAIQADGFASAADAFAAFDAE